MKKTFIAFAAMLCIFSFGVALADDGANTYKTYCQGCHGPDGSKVPPNAAAAIKGQSAADILKMLEGYKDGSFGGKSKQVMSGVVKRLTDGQMKEVADFVSKL